MDEQPKLMQLGTAIDITPGPDGNPWIRVQILVGISAYVFTVPASAGEEWIKEFERKFSQTVAIAKRQESGLVVASPDIVGQIENANRAERRRNARASGHRNSMGTS